MGCATRKFSKPLEKLDFKANNWQIVYVEDESDPITYNYTWKFWLLENNKMIDSLKDQYKCDLKKQCDGDNEYQIFIFKDHLHSDWNLFCDNKFFSLGNLKQNLIPVNTSYFECLNQHLAKATIDSLVKEGVYYTITQVEPIVKSKNEFAMILDLDINVGSKLFRNNDTLFNSWTPNAQKELVRLFPELTIEDVSFSELGNSNELSGPAPGYMPNPKGYCFMHKKLRFVLSQNHPFAFDEERLKGTDLFLSHHIRTMFIVTAYVKK